jgi:hypothetical protein
MSYELDTARRIRELLFEDGYQDVNIVIEMLDELIHKLATPRGGE